MAPLPKRRHSSRRGGKRKAAISLKRAQLVICPNCRAARLSHRVCNNCGWYNGKPVMVKKEKKRGS